MTEVQKSKSIGLVGSLTYEDAEKLIASVGTLDRDADYSLRVNSNYPGNIFGDLWVALAAGAHLRSDLNVKTVTAGINNDHDFRCEKFTSTMPGLVSSFLSSGIQRDGAGDAIDRKSIQNWIENEKRGFIDSSKGSEQVVVEIDDARASILTDLAYKSSIDRKVFEALVLRIRSKLNVWNRGEARNDVEAVRDLSSFLKELFENAFVHGQLKQDLFLPKAKEVRVLRFRKIISGSTDGLIERTKGSIPGVREFVERSVKDEKAKDFLEVSVSDFGDGILDKFLASSPGKSYKNVARGPIMDKILHGRLSSNALDPAAGLGIPKALRAARSLNAFVSLRTAEFHFARSFIDASDDFKLKPVSDKPLGKVPGTHWQFLWSPPR